MSFKLRKPKLSTGAIVGTVGVAFVVGSAGGAYANHLIHTRDIANHNVTWAKLSPGVHSAINKPGPKGPKGATGARGATGATGADGLQGAVYRVENYENGGGGDATVACADDETQSQKYTAIAGGVEAGHTGTNTFAVAASFPGRMDWDTGEPKPNRLDGWIVLGNGQYTSDLKVWALCVPNTDIQVQTVNLDN